MGDPLIRTRMLIGDDPIERLKQSKRLLQISLKNTRMLLL